MLQSVRFSWRASEYEDDITLLTKRFFDHPAISADDYSHALSFS